jgi:hypothetical protein
LAFQSATEATDVPLTLQVFTSTEKGPHPKWSDESKLTSNLTTSIKQATNERAPIERQHLTPLHTNSQVYRGRNDYSTRGDEAIVTA